MVLNYQDAQSTIRRHAIPALTWAAETQSSSLSSLDSTIVSKTPSMPFSRMNSRKTLKSVIGDGFIT